MLATSTLAAGSGPVVATTALAVSSAVTAGAKVTRVPTALKPTLQGVSSDAPAGSACGTTASACVAGSSSATKHLVVFGDSHAAMWFSALSLGLGSKYHLLLKWNASCPAAALTVHDDAIVKGADCNAWRDAALAQIIAQHPSAVIIAERTSAVNDVNGVVFSAAQWQAGLLVTLNTLHQANIKTIVLGDTPTFATLPASCVAQHPTAVKTCNLSLQGSGAIPYLANAEKAAAQTAGAKFVPTIGLFCTTTVCPTIVNNIFVYFDRSHMTQTYSVYLSKVISKLTGL